MRDGRPWPRISIVTPVRNGAESVEETIRSVLLQGYPDLEYYVVDGASTDGTLDIVKEYAPWLSGWASESDSGMSEAINKGWRRATGEIIAWLNADDTYRSGTLSDVACVFGANPKATLVYGQVSKSSGCGPAILVGEPYNLLECLKNALLARISQPGTFYSRLAVTRVGWLDESLHDSMDRDLLQRLAAIGQVVFVPKTWACFRIRAGQLSDQHERDPSFVLYREYLSALHGLYAIPGLSDEVRRLRRRAEAAWRMRIAKSARQRGFYTEALWNLALASTYPAIFAEPQWRSVFLDAVLGQRGRRMLGL